MNNFTNYVLFLGVEDGNFVEMFLEFDRAFRFYLIINSHNLMNHDTIEEALPHRLTARSWIISKHVLP